MNYRKERSGLLWLTIILWITYIVCAIVFGLSSKFVKLLSVTTIGFSWYLLFYIKMHIEAKKEA